MRLVSLALLSLLQGCTSMNTKHSLIDGIARGGHERLILEKKAEEERDPLSASRLAQHYLLVEEDYDRARYWFKKAAEHGGDKERAAYESFEEALK